MNKEPLFAADPLLKHALILYQEIYIVKGFSGMYSNALNCCQLLC